MATLTVQTVSEDGLDLGAMTAVNASDVFDNDGKTLLYVYNGSGGDITITIQANGVGASFSVPGYGTVEKADKTLTISTTHFGVLGPFPRAAYNDSSGQVTVTYSGTSSVVAEAVTYAGS